ncbi:methyltransferase [Nocardiopsis listeri]|uniref:methyltransferase n=1 Tax=Nocardiopsis listeri TaxID=53440 RepID=UPI0008321905|nr:methyltransferase [Nocardiopsis listeri]
MERPDTIPPERTDRPLARIVSSAMLLHAVAALIELGVVEELAGPPRPLDDVARALTVPEERLLVLVRAAVATGLVEEPSPGLFSLSSAGDHLRIDDPQGLRDLFRMCTHGDFFQAWTRLGHSVTSDRSAFAIHTGQELFAYLSEREAAAAVFNRAMNSSTLAAPLLREIDPAETGTMVDLGGGEGATIAAVLRACPSTRGILFDLPHVVEGAPPLLREAGVEDRCSIVGGDFFEGVPRGADVYLAARVMQNWADPDAALILRNVREAMGATSRLLIVGHLPEQDRPSEFLEAMSLSMFVLYGAPLRTREQYEALLASVGLSLHEVRRVPDGESIMDVRPMP